MGKDINRLKDFIAKNEASIAKRIALNNKREARIAETFEQYKDRLESDGCAKNKLNALKEKLECSKRTLDSLIKKVKRQKQDLADALADIDESADAEPRLTCERDHLCSMLPECVRQFVFNRLMNEYNSILQMDASERAIHANADTFEILMTLAERAYGIIGDIANWKWKPVGAGDFEVYAYGAENLSYYVRIRTTIVCGHLRQTGRGLIFVRAHTRDIVRKILK